jgi:hypothetical protein
MILEENNKFYNNKKCILSRDDKDKKFEII